MMKSVIIEDEERSRIVLRNLIETYCPEVEVTAVAESVKTGIEALHANKPDLIFLDVRLNDGTGFDVLERANPVTGAVIFTTAFDHYAIKAFKFSAIDYLLKPIDIDDLKQAVQKAAKTIDHDLDELKVQNLLSNWRRKPEENPVILVSTMESIEFVHIEDIVRCEASGGYSTIFTKDSKPLLVSKVIKEFEFLLKEHGFFRIHQSHLVNLKQVRKFVRAHNSIILRDGTELQVARSRKDGLFAQMDELRI